MAGSYKHDAPQRSACPTLSCLKPKAVAAVQGLPVFAECK